MIWAFGDSFTWGSCHEDISLLDLTGNVRLETTYIDFVGKALKDEVINFSWPGNSNLAILISFLKRVRRFRRGDTVIVNMTSWGRGVMPLLTEDGDTTLCGMVPLAIENGHYPYDTFPDPDQYFPPTDIAKRYVESLMVYENEPTMGPLLTKEYVAVYHSLMVELSRRGVKMYVWDHDWAWYRLDLHYNEPSEKWYCPCGHWNENGHEWFSKRLISFMKKNKYGYMERSKKNIYGNLKF